MKKKKKKKIKINKRKLYSRLFILILLIAVIVFIIKGLTKKEDKKFDISIIMGNEDITNDLADEPYISNDGNLYLSVEDIRKVFDKTIYFEEDTKKIITTSETKVAAIDVENDTIELNTASRELSSEVLDYGKNKYYLPVSALTNIYNIEVFTKEKSAIICSLYDEFTTVKTSKKAKVKEKAGAFKKTLQKLDKDTEIIYLGQAEKKGYVKVMTYERMYSDISRVKK